MKLKIKVERKIAKIRCEVEDKDLKKLILLILTLLIYVLGQ